MPPLGIRLIVDIEPGAGMPLDCGADQVAP
jgi:hypothetical protein